MFKSWKTTVAGIVNLGCLIAPIFCPAAIIPCAKIASAVTAWGFLVAKDHVEEGPQVQAPAGSSPGETQKAPSAKTPTMLLVIIGLGGLAIATCAFTGSDVTYGPRLFVGVTNNPTFVCGVGSLYVNYGSSNQPVVYVKTTTNNFARVVNTNSLPLDLRVSTLTVTNAIYFATPAGDYTNLTLASDGEGYLVATNEGGHPVNFSTDYLYVANELTVNSTANFISGTFTGDLNVGGVLTADNETSLRGDNNFGNVIADQIQVSGVVSLPNMTTNKYLLLDHDHFLKASAAP